MKSFPFLLLILLTSCGLFAPRETLQSKDRMELLKGLAIVGEGRGRLTVEERQNVFSFDALLREDSDWVFAASIPLHGEEAMILPQIKLKEFQNINLKSEFELRLIHVLKSQKQWKISPVEFKRRLRNLVRLLLAPKLGNSVKCDSELCHADDVNFKTSVQNEVFSIEEVDQKDFKLLAQGRNLTESFFTQTIISLYDMNNDEIFSLELFWK